MKKELGIASRVGMLLKNPNYFYHFESTELGFCIGSTDKHPITDSASQGRFFSWHFFG
jgi:hypothetical protein